MLFESGGTRERVYQPRLHRKYDKKGTKTRGYEISVGLIYKIQHGEGIRKGSNDLE